MRLGPLLAIGLIVGSLGCSTKPPPELPQSEPENREPEPEGRLERAVIQARVRQDLARMHACYQRALETNPSLEGRVVTRFIIEQDGSVTRAEADPGTTMHDPMVVHCVVGAFRELVFPQPEGGIVTVVYPITFTPG